MTISLKLGRRARVRRVGVPHLSSILAGRELPPLPPSVNYSRAIASQPLGAMLNNQLGCCTCAAVYHSLQVWTANANPPMQTEPDSNVMMLYIEACGYNPHAPLVNGENPTDQGGIEQDVLTYLLNRGAPVGQGGRHKIDAFVEVDPRHLDDVKRTIADCGVAYIGFNVPSFLMNGLTAPNSDWDVQPGTADIVGGHAVYGIIDRDWVERTGKTPFGQSEPDLVDAMRAISKAA